MSGDGHWLISTRDPSLCSMCGETKVEELVSTAGPMRHCATHASLSHLRGRLWKMRSMVNGKEPADYETLLQEMSKAVRDIESALAQRRDVLAARHEMKEQRERDEAAHDAYMASRGIQKSETD